MLLLLADNRPAASSAAATNNAVLPRRATQQPRTVARLNAAHPLARFLVSAATMDASGTMYDAVLRQPWTRSTGKVAPTASGIAAFGPWTAPFSAATLLGSSANVFATVAMLAIPNTNGGDHTWFGGGASPSSMRLSSSDKWGVYGGSSFGTTAVKVGVPQFVALCCRNGFGYLNVDGVPAGNSPYNLPGFDAGATSALNVGDAGSVPLFFAFNKALSDQEMADLAANPWALFLAESPRMPAPVPAVATSTATAGLAMLPRWFADRQPQRVAQINQRLGIKFLLNPALGTTDLVGGLKLTSSYNTPTRGVGAQGVARAYPGASDYYDTAGALRSTTAYSILIYANVTSMSGFAGLFARTTDSGTGNGLQILQANGSELRILENANFYTTSQLASKIVGAGPVGIVVRWNSIGGRCSLWVNGQLLFDDAGNVTTAPGYIAGQGRIKVFSSRDVPGVTGNMYLTAYAPDVAWDDRTAQALSLNPWAIYESDRPRMLASASTVAAVATVPGLPVLPRWFAQSQPKRAARISTRWNDKLWFAFLPSASTLNPIAGKYTAGAWAAGAVPTLATSGGMAASTGASSISITGTSAGASSGGLTILVIARRNGSSGVQAAINRGSNNNPGQFEIALSNNGGSPATRLWSSYYRDTNVRTAFDAGYVNGMADSLNGTFDTVVGQFYTIVARADQLGAANGANISIGSGLSGEVLFAAVWDMKLSNAEMRELSANPWRIFEADQPRMLASAAAATVPATTLPGLAVLPRRFADRQPQRVPRMARSNSLSSGLVALVPFAQRNVDAARNASHTYQNAPPMGATVQGIGPALNGSNQNIKLGFQVSGPEGTLMLLAYFPATPTGCAVAQNGSNDGYMGVGWQGTNVFVGGNSAGSLGAFSGLRNIATTWSASRNGGGYLDGVKKLPIISGLAPDVNPSLTYPLIVGSASYSGAQNGYAFNAQTPLLLAYWNRALTDAEIAEVSANPWQLFEAEQPRILASAPGVATATPVAFAAQLSAAAAAVASTTAALSAWASLAASPAGVATATAAATAKAALVAAPAAVAAASASLSARASLVASAAALASASADLTATTAGSATAAGLAVLPRRVAYRQPQAPRLDRRNRLAQGAQAVYVATQDVNLAGGKKLSATGTINPKMASASGVVQQFRKNGYLQTEVMPAIGTQTFVEFWYGVPLDYRNLGAAGGYNEAFVTGSNSNNIGLFLGGGNTGADTSTNTWGAIYNWAGLNKTTDVIPLGVLTLLVMVRRQDRMELWRDGRLVATFMQAPTSYVASSLILGSFIEDVGYWSSSSDTLMAGRIVNDWSAADVQAFSANPWQLLESDGPRMLASASGSTVALAADLSAAAAAVASVTGALNAPAVLAASPAVIAGASASLATQATLAASAAALATASAAATVRASLAASPIAQALASAGLISGPATLSAAAAGAASVTASLTAVGGSMQAAAQAQAQATAVLAAGPAALVAPGAALASATAALTAGASLVAAASATASASASLQARASLAAAAGGVATSTASMTTAAGTYADLQAVASMSASLTVRAALAAGAIATASSGAVLLASVALQASPAAQASASAALQAGSAKLAAAAAAQATAGATLSAGNGLFANLSASSSATASLTVAPVVLAAAAQASASSSAALATVIALVAAPAATAGATAALSVRAALAAQPGAVAAATASLTAVPGSYAANAAAQASAGANLSTRPVLAASATAQATAGASLTALGQAATAAAQASASMTASLSTRSVLAAAAVAQAQSSASMAARASLAASPATGRAAMTADLTTTIALAAAAATRGNVAPPFLDTAITLFADIGAQVSVAANLRTQALLAADAQAVWTVTGKLPDPPGMELDMRVVASMTASLSAYSSHFALRPEMVTGPLLRRGVVGASRRTVVTASLKNKVRSIR